MISIAGIVKARNLLVEKLLEIHDKYGSKKLSDNIPFHKMTSEEKDIYNHLDDAILSLDKAIRIRFEGCDD